MIGFVLKQIILHLYFYSVLYTIYNINIKLKIKQMLINVENIVTGFTIIFIYVFLRYWRVHGETEEPNRPWQNQTSSVQKGLYWL